MLVQQEQIQVSPELVKKFDNDRELVAELLHDFTVEELEASTIVHPTKNDPVILLNGKVVGMWL
jgi:hypothetical protein